MADLFPFPCEECEGRERPEFAVFEPTNDWLMAYPEKNLIHIHLGQSLVDDQISMAESNFQCSWVLALLSRFPHKQFFFMIDMTRKDNREIMPLEARQNLKQLLTHPQMPQGAAYGLTWAWRMFGNMMNIMGANVALKVTKEAADKKYADWYSQQVS